MSLHAICLSRGPKYLLCEVEMWLQFLKRNPEILNGHAFGNEFRTVSPNVMRTQPQLLRKNTPVLSGPVQPRAPPARTRLERANLAIRQRQTVDVIAKRKGTGGHFLKQLEPLQVSQFVERRRIGAIGIRATIGTALEREYLQPFFGQFLGHDRATPSKADNHDVHRPYRLRRYTTASL